MEKVKPWIISFHMMIFFFILHNWAMTIKSIGPYLEGSGALHSIIENRSNYNLSMLLLIND